MLTLTLSTITRNDKRIQEDYVVAIGENKSPPDVRLVTDDARIDSAIYLTGTVPRAARVEAVTHDSSVRLRVQREEGQAVEISATTTDSESPSPPFLSVLSAPAPGVGHPGSHHRADYSARTHHLQSSSFPFVKES